MHKSNCGSKAIGFTAAVFVLKGRDHGIFEQINGVVTAGTITSVLVGDVNGDGIIEYNDVMLAYKAFLGEAELTEEQLAVVDTNRNGTIEEAEYHAIYQIYIGG